MSASRLDVDLQHFGAAAMRPNGTGGLLRAGRVSPVGEPTSAPCGAADGDRLPMPLDAPVTSTIFPASLTSPPVRGPPALTSKFQHIRALHLTREPGCGCW